MGLDHVDWITLESWRIDCIIGLLDRERVTAQPLDLEMRLGLDLRRAGDADDLTASADYAAVCDHVSFLATEGRFRLLETLALAIARLTLASPEPDEPRAAVRTVKIALKKPAVLGGRAIPGIAVAWDAGALPIPDRRVAAGVREQLLCSTATTTAARVRVSPGAHVTVPAQTSVLVLTGAIDTDHGPLTAGGRRGRGASQRLSNAGDAPATLLVVWSPGGPPIYVETP